MYNLLKKKITIQTHSTDTINIFEILPYLIRHGILLNNSKEEFC